MKNPSIGAGTAPGDQAHAPFFGPWTEAISARQSYYKSYWDDTRVELINFILSVLHI